MVCITVSVGHSGSGTNAIIYFNATDGNLNLYGDQAFGWGGYGTPTDTEYKSAVTPYILDWFGVSGTQTVLCPSVIPPGTDNNTGLMILAAVAIGAFLLLRGKK